MSLDVYRARRAGLVGAWCVGLALLVSPGAEAQEPSRCPEIVAPQAPAPVLSPPRGGGRLVPVDSRGQPVEGNAPVLTLPFDSERTPLERTQTFRLPRGIPPRSVRAAAVNNLVDPNTQRVLPIRRNQLTFRAAPNPVRGTLVNVSFCYDPAQPVAVRSGRFEGALLVGAPGVEPTPLSLSVTLRDERWWRAAIAALVGLLAGLFIRAGADKRFGPVAPKRGKRTAYLTNFRFVVAVGAGVVAGYYSYRTIYLDDPVFAADIGNLWRITAETFTGTLASKAITDFAPPTGKEKSKGLARD